MIQGQSVLGLIPARGGSKGIPRKNVRPVAGKPLIAWTVEAALGSRVIDRVVLTTDNDEIAEVAASFGCEVPFRRPAELASDETDTLDAVLHALDNLDKSYDWLVLLQPTSPLRLSADIDSAVEACLAAGAASCVSVTDVEKPPAWMYTLRDNRLQPLLDSNVAARRQVAPKAFALNGAVYVIRVDHLRRIRSFVDADTVAYIMPRERSIDVDVELDLRLVEFMKAN